MINKDLMRDPVARKRLGKTIDKAVPDLAYEISSQSLDKESGGTTPVCASICLTAYVTGIVTSMVTAASSKSQPWNPEDGEPYNPGPGGQHENPPKPPSR